ncbi:MAG: NRDE family protein [Saprospiraceae bacterium]
MCTVTYIPKGENEFILTSNRDEAPSRSPKDLSTESLDKGKILFPKDTKAGGTWIAVSSQNQVACILNGAFKKHSHRPPYKMSRGKMVLDIFKEKSALDYFNHFDLEGMEPFTLVFYDKGYLWEFRWDEQMFHQTPLPVDSPRIWSSSTLYPSEMQEKREAYFNNWLQKNHAPNREEILHLHRTGGVGDPRYDYVMNRENIVRTVSITSIQKKSDQVHMKYFDLLSDEPQKSIEDQIEIKPGFFQPAF